MKILVMTQFLERCEAMVRAFRYRWRPAGSLLFPGTPTPPARCRHYLSTLPHRSNTNPSPFAFNSNGLIVSNCVITGDFPCFPPFVGYVITLRLWKAM